MSDDSLKETDAPYRADESRSPYSAMADELYRQEVLEARRMSAEEKLILGERLFRWGCAITLQGIHFQNPGATEAECQKLLSERIALGKELGTL